MTRTEPTRAPKKADAADIDHRVLDLYNAGHSRNSISRELGISTRQVDYSARRQSLTFDADRTAAAVAVHTASAGEAHRKLAGRFRDLADQCLNRANDNICSPDVMWQYTRSAAVATDKSIALSDLDARTMHGGDMQDAMNRFAEFGALVRGTAAAQRGEEPP